MAEYANPALWSAAPTDQTVPVYDAAIDRVVPTAIASIGSPLTVPGTHIAAASAPSAATTSDLATTSATQTTPWGFASEAQAEAIATKFNLAVTDIDTLVTELGALTTTVNTVISELQTAGVLAAS